MAQLAVPIMMVAGTALSAYGSYQQGKAADEAAQYEADQMQANAARAAEAGIKRAEEMRRQQRVAVSNARAAQASSGGTTTDPGALLQIGSLSAAFERNALEELYQSNLDSAALQAQAAARRFEGRTARRAGNVAALSTVLSSAGSIYSSSRSTIQESLQSLRMRKTPRVPGVDLGNTMRTRGIG